MIKGNTLLVSQVFSDDYLEEFRFEISLKRFGLKVYSNDVLTMEVAPEGVGLLVESTQYFHTEAPAKEKVVCADEDKDCDPEEEVVDLSYSETSVGSVVH